MAGVDVDATLVDTQLSGARRQHDKVRQGSQNPLLRHFIAKSKAPLVQNALALTLPVVALDRPTAHRRLRSLQWLTDVQHWIAQV